MAARFFNRDTPRGWRRRHESRCSRKLLRPAARKQRRRTPYNKLGRKWPCQPMCPSRRRRALAMHGIARPTQLLCRRTLQANSSGMFTAEALMVALEPLIEAAAFSLEDVSVVDKPGVTTTCRWTIKLAGRDARRAARLAGVLVAAMRGGSGWKKVEVTTVAGEIAALYVALGRSPKTLKIEIPGKRHSGASQAAPASGVEAATRRGGYLRRLPANRQTG